MQSESKKPEITVMRTGILGGSFNPVHKDHYLLASYIKKVLSLDRFLIIPNAMPPHKNTCHISFDDRVRMLTLSSFASDGFEISDIEKDPDIRHYSFDTLEKLKTLYHDDALFFCMGMDSLAYLDKWYRGLELIKFANLVVTGREGYSYNDINSDVIPFIRKYSLDSSEISDENELIKYKDIDFVNNHYCIILKRCFHNVSSSKIRKEFKDYYQKYENSAKKSVFFEHIDDYPCCKNYLNKYVIEYILDKGIYKQQ